MRAFRTSLFETLNINKASWEEYWNHMKSYRDDFVAHSENRSEVSDYPKLDIALKSCYFYYDYLINELRLLGVNRYPDDLREYCTRFARQAKEIGQKALSATSALKETVR